MSDSVYVQALDGLLYKDPIIYSDGWFVQFGPPEIVIVRYEKTGEKAARARAGLLLRGAGIEYKRLTVTDAKSGRAFPPTWKAKGAVALSFELTGPIPIPRNYGGIKIIPAKIDATTLMFWYDFDTELILANYSGEEIDLFLASALFHWTETPTKEEMYKRLKIQFPWIEDRTDLPPKLRVQWQSSKDCGN